MEVRDPVHGFVHLSEAEKQFWELKQYVKRFIIGLRKRRKEVVYNG